MEKSTYPIELLENPSIQLWSLELIKILKGTKLDHIQRIGRSDNYINNLIYFSQSPSKSQIFLDTALNEILEFLDIRQLDFSKESMEKLFLLRTGTIADNSFLIDQLEYIINQDDTSHEIDLKREFIHVMTEIVGINVLRKNSVLSDSYRYLLGVQLREISEMGGELTGLAYYWLYKLQYDRSGSLSKDSQRIQNNEISMGSFLNWILNYENDVVLFNEILTELYKTDPNTFIQILDEQCDARLEVFPFRICQGTKELFIDMDLKSLSTLSGKVLINAESEIKSYIKD